MSVAASAAALIGAEAFIVGSLAFAATVASYASARRQQRKAQQRAEEQSNAAERQLLQSRRRYRDTGLAPRDVVYGRVARAGVLTYSAPNRIPTFDARATNSMVFALSGRPIHQFNAAIFREKFLGDFDAAAGPGAHSDTTLLDFAVPATADPVPATDPGPKIGDGDARLFASLGHDPTLRVPNDPGLFGELRAANASGEMKMYGCAWAAHLVKQIDPETNEGLSSAGRPDIMWDMLGARVRNFCKHGSGRKIFAAIVPLAEPAADASAETSSAAALATLEERALIDAREASGGFHILGIMGEAPSRSGRRQQNIFIFGNDGAKKLRDNLLTAAGVAVVEEPAAGADERLITGSGDIETDGAAATTIPLPAGRNINDYVQMIFNVVGGGGNGIKILARPDQITRQGGLERAYRSGKVVITAASDGTNLSWDFVNADGTPTTDLTIKLQECRGRAPLANRRGGALTAWRAFLANEENVAAANQLHPLCEDANGTISTVGNALWGAATWGRWFDASTLAGASAEITEEAWAALPTQFSQNPVLTFLDWVSDSSRPSGFKVNMQRQLEMLPNLEGDADYCDTLLRLHSASFSALFTGQSRYFGVFVWNGRRTSFPAVHARVTFKGETKEVMLVAAKSGITFECTMHEGGDGGRGEYESTCQRDVPQGDYDDFDVDVEFGTGASAVTVRIFGDALFEHAHTVSAKMDLNAYVSMTEDGDFGGVEFFTTGSYRGRIETTDHGLVTDVNRNESAARMALEAATRVSLVGASGTGALSVLPVATGNVALGSATLKITRGSDQRLSYSLVDKDDNPVDAILEWWGPRFRFNGIVSMGDSERQNLRLWEQAVQGDVYDEGGALRLRVARWTEPVATLTAADFAREGDVEWAPSEPVENIKTATTAAYLDVGENWNEKEIEPVEDKVALHDSGGIKRIESVVMPFANSAWEATAYARLRLALARHSGKMTIGLLRWDAARFERGDRIRLAAGLFGLKRETTWRIESMRFLFPRGVTLELREDVESSYRDEFMTTAPGTALDYFEGPGVTSGGEAVTFDGEGIRE